MSSSTIVNVTASPYTILSNSYKIIVNSAANCVMTMPNVMFQSDNIQIINLANTTLIVNDINGTLIDNVSPTNGTITFAPNQLRNSWLEIDGFGSYTGISAPIIPPTSSATAVAWAEGITATYTNMTVTTAGPTAVSGTGNIHLTADAPANWTMIIPGNPTVNGVLMKFTGVNNANYWTALLLGSNDNFTTSKTLYNFVPADMQSAIATYRQFPNNLGYRSYRLDILTNVGAFATPLLTAFQLYGYYP
jgi:hypothetical protein